MLINYSSSLIKIHLQLIRNSLMLIYPSMAVASQIFLICQYGQRMDKSLGYIVSCCGSSIGRHFKSTRMYCYANYICCLSKMIATERLTPNSCFN